LKQQYFKLKKERKKLQNKQHHTQVKLI